MEKIIELIVLKGYNDLSLNKHFVRGNVITLYSNEKYIDKDGLPCSYDIRAITLIETKRLKLKSIKNLENK